MSLRSVLVVVLALACGFAATIGALQLIRQPIAKAASTETVKVLVASRDVARGTTVTEDMLKFSEWPKDLLPSGALTKVDDAVERVASTPLVKDRPVYNSELTPRGGGRGMAALTPKGMRSVTIQTPSVASSVAGFVLPGNKVDILLTVTGGRDQTGGGLTVRLLQNVEVLAVDQRIDAPSENKVDPSKQRSVTLLVAPGQDAMLALAQNKGTLHLSLRNPQDTVAADTPPVSLRELERILAAEETTPLKVDPEVVPAVAVERPQPPPPPLEIRTVRGTSDSHLKIYEVMPPAASKR